MPETERKFLLNGSPTLLVKDTPAVTEQGYLITEGGELRIRRKNGACFLTVKGEGTLSRDEWETPIPDWVFEALWPQTEGRRVEKTRYKLPREEGHPLEIDVYKGRLEGLLVLECEFDSEDEARRFVLPTWAADAVEVTEDKSYKNKNLAVWGQPGRR